MKKLFLISALGVFSFFSISQTAIGANWVKTYGDEQRTNYIDLNSITKTEKGIVRFWGKVESFNDKVSLSMLYMEVDCKEKRIRPLQITVYYTYGSTETNIESEWESITPETTGELTYKIVCS
jgi:hypothetical protein